MRQKTNTTLFILSFFILILSKITIAQTTAPDFSIMFYNVENLFDTIDDPTKNDNEFLPQSQKKWNSYKYYKKLKQISQVIVASGQWHSPDIVGFCEIENYSCLHALTHHTALSRLEYKIIHYESPDDRGIDVGMIYNPRTFSPLSSQAIRISFEHALQTNTRDILYVKGFANALADTIHVFVCHFPSRSGGVHNTEIKRIVAANTLRKVVDSIFTVHAPSNICIIGDFNDSPHDKSIQQILCAHTPDKLSHEKQLVNLVDTKARGTHAFGGNWECLDQIIVSQALYGTYNLRPQVMELPFLLEYHAKQESYTPYRTYRGPHYMGGYSDHLPILLEIQKK